MSNYQWLKEDEYDILASCDNEVRIETQGKEARKKYAMVNVQLAIING